MVALGEALYHDTLLSADGTVSCATCHGLDTGGVDRLPVSTGVKNQQGPINAPTVYNSSYNFVQFWDGRAGSLEEQAAGPVANPLEMGDDWPTVVKKVAASERYRGAFDELFGGEVTTETITKAIAEFERTLITPNSRFDQYLEGDKTALTDEEKRGALLFAESGCMSCHSGSFFGGRDYQKLADSYFEGRGGETDADLGRYNVTNDPAHRHMFKTPILRNVEVTWPYFHDGSAPDLETAVTTMAKHQLGLDMPAQDASAVAAFLKTLTGEYKGAPLTQMDAR